MSRLILETRHLDSIPFITLGREDLSRAPVVFYLHGFSGDKTSELSLGYMLAQRGFMYVALDAHLHGERQPHWTDPLPEYVYPPDAGLDLWATAFRDVMPGTARDVSTLLDHLTSDERADTSRVGVAGASMGGRISFYLAAHEPRIGAIATLISTPRWSAVWERVLAEAWADERWRDSLAGLEPQAQQHSEMVRAVDPVEEVMDFAPRPLLMIQGDRDNILAPKHDPVALYRTLLPLYAEHPDRLRLRLYPGIDHRVTRDMLVETAEWFAAHLC